MIVRTSNFKYLLKITIEFNFNNSDFYPILKNRMFLNYREKCILFPNEFLNPESVNMQCFNSQNREQSEKNVIIEPTSIPGLLSRRLKSERKERNKFSSSLFFPILNVEREEARGCNRTSLIHF